MWGERMAGDKEGCLKLVLLQKNTSENTALVLQCIFCIKGYWSQLSCRPLSTNYEHLMFVCCSSPLDPVLAPAASIDTIQQRLCLLTTGEQWMFLLQVGLWQMSIWKPPSSNLRYCCLQVSFLLFCQKCLSGRVSRRECLSLSCSKYSVWYLSSAKLFPHISSASCTTRITFRHSNSWLWEEFYSHSTDWGGGWKVSFHVLARYSFCFCSPVFPWLPCPYPLSQLDSLQWGSMSVPDALLSHLRSAVHFPLWS